MNEAHKHTVPYDLIAKYLAKEVDDAERQLVMDWILENEEAFERLVRSWEQVDQALQTEAVNVDVAWRKLKGEMKVSEPKAVLIKPLWQRAMTIAASILLISAVGWAIVNLIRPSKQAELQITETQSDTTSVNLKDGSLITLNTESQLSYPENFDSDTREVYLEGEAFFEVAKDAQRPFIIHVEEVHIRVLGTSFNVFARKEADSIVVAVTSGQVEVYTLKGKRKLAIDTLEAGLQATYIKSKNVLSTQPQTDAEYLFWKKAELNLQGMNMEKAASILADFYQVEIMLDPKLKDCRGISAFDLNQQDVEYVLDILAATFKFDIRENQGVYTLSATEQSCQ